MHGDFAFRSQFRICVFFRATRYQVVPGSTSPPLFSGIGSGKLALHMDPIAAPMYRPSRPYKTSRTFRLAAACGRTLTAFWSNSTNVKCQLPVKIVTKEVLTPVVMEHARL